MKDVHEEASGLELLVLQDLADIQDRRAWQAFPLPRLKDLVFGMSVEPLLKYRLQLQSALGPVDRAGEPLVVNQPRLPDHTREIRPHTRSEWKKAHVTVLAAECADGIGLAASGGGHTRLPAAVGLP